ncbi:hypothetical protein, partial [Candidatus Entotheonella palauensis]|uniref:hypothetical protein n=1 Tax=Candidatus Entotheonella palauensis TaxID=93172 RepID=UPI001C4E01CA
PAAMHRQNPRIFSWITVAMAWVAYPLIKLQCCSQSNDIPGRPNLRFDDFIYIQRTKPYDMTQ